MVAKNGGLEAAEGYVRIYFGDGKGAATGIRQVWQGRGRRGGSVIVFRERRILIYWDGYRGRPCGQMILCGDKMVSKG